MKKIDILHPQMCVKGGAIKTLLLIGNHLQEKGNMVNFYTFCLDRSNCFSELNKDLPIINYSSSGINKFLAFLKIVFNLRKTDVVIAGNSPMHFVAVFAKIFHPKLKVIWYLQNIPVYYFEPNKGIFILIKRFLEKLIIPFIDKIIVNSSFIGNEVRKYFDKNSIVIYPCIDTDFFTNNHQSLEENQTIFTYSRLVKGKNIELAINAYQELQKKYPGLKLVIGGDGEEKEKLQELAQFYSDVQFLGEIGPEEIKSNLQKCTVFLFTSLIDAFGLTILEAMSMEKSMVVLNNGGAKEIISNCENGYLANTQEEFISYIDELLKNPELRKEMGQKGRQCVSGHFSLNSMYKGIDKVLDLV